MIKTVYKYKHYIVYIYALKLKFKALEVLKQGDLTLEIII